MSSTLFALDIGTRSVVGTIIKEIQGQYHVVDLVSIEHKKRSMIDGQIHNILNVAEVIIEIKEQLEEKHGPLKEVSVAAAGRALVTEQGMVSLDLAKASIISQEDIHRLELSAVQQAQQILIEKTIHEERDHYYCVGYSVLHYKLDDQKIGNLIEQIGKTASVQVIATFLPQVVVESLLAALKRAELEMAALTLEPIAAIHVLIPPSMRKLNIALVDVGAGTSDIALANDGTITAYGMVPLAGDEVTDALSSEYLLDFPIAEKIKRQLGQQETVEIEDILGFVQETPVSDINTCLLPTIQRIAHAIAQEIQQLNSGQSPKAVILVGGGSLTPQLAKELSLALDLPENRVGVRGLEALNGVTIAQDFGSSPELITPIGIAIAAKKSPLHYMAVTVNNQPVRLFELKEMTVTDALIASNFTMEQLYGKPGRGITITFNDAPLVIPGELGKPSTVTLNGKHATLKDQIQNHDVIEVIAGENGIDAAPTVNDLTDGLSAINITIDGRTITLKPEILINQKPGQLNSMIQDRDHVKIAHNTSLQKALEHYGIPPSMQQLSILVDGKSMHLKNWQPQYFLGQLPIKPTHNLQDGDIVTIENPALPTVQEVASNLNIHLNEQIFITFNGENIQVKKARYTITRNGEVVDETECIQQADQIEFTSIPYTPIVFSDVFAFTNYQLPKNASGPYQLLRNGSSIQLNDQIFHGDNLEIAFQIRDIRI